MYVKTMPKWYPKVVSAKGVRNGIRNGIRKGIRKGRWLVSEMVSEMVSEKVSAVFHYVFMFLKFAETLFCVSFGILFLYHFYIVSASFWIPFRRSFGIPFWHRFGTSFRHAHNVSLDMLCRMFWICFLAPSFRYYCTHFLIHCLTHSCMHFRAAMFFCKNSLFDMLDCVSIYLIPSILVESNLI